MNLTKNVEESLLGTQCVFFKIETLTYPYSKLPVDNPNETVINDVLGLIRVPTMVIDEIKKAPLGGPITSILSGKERIIELLFLTGHDVAHTDTFLEVLSEKIEYLQRDVKPLTLWVFIPQVALPTTAGYFLEKNAQDVLIYRSYDQGMQPYVLTHEKKIKDGSTGFYCRSFKRS